MLWFNLLLPILLSISDFAYSIDESRLVDAEKTLVWGPGLKPDEVVLPARYFFIHAVDKNGRKCVEYLHK